MARSLPSSSKLIKGIPSSSSEVPLTHLDAVVITNEDASARSGGVANVIKAIALCRSGRPTNDYTDSAKMFAGGFPYLFPCGLPKDADV